MKPRRCPCCKQPLNYVTEMQNIFENIVRLARIGALTSQKITEQNKSGWKSWKELRRELKKPDEKE